MLPTYFKVCYNKDITRKRGFPMQYYDQHVHTAYSFDSTEKIEAYITNHQPHYFVTTEHLDFSNPSDGGCDSIPDYLAYTEEIKKLTPLYPTKFLKGIEIGYVKTHQKQIKKFLENKNFDLILLSVHQDGNKDFMDPLVLEENPEKLIVDYYTRMIEAIEVMSEANILTHFDYGVRRLKISVTDYQKIAEPYLEKVFQLIIKKELALELNGKSFKSYGNQHLYEYALPLYQRLGGKLFTLGSDAHQTNKYELAFSEMKQCLTKLNIAELATYQNQTLKMVPLILD